MSNKLIQILLFSILYLIIPLVVSAEENYDAYNLKVEIPEEYQNINSGEKIWFTTKILNLASNGRVDVTIKYSVLDVLGKEVVSRSETIAIETQASFVGNLILPKDILEGDYTLLVEMVGQSSNISKGEITFKVLNKDSKEEYIYLSLLLIIFFILTYLSKIFVKSYLIRLKIKKKIDRIIKKKIEEKKLSLGDFDNINISKKNDIRLKEEKIF